MLPAGRSRMMRDAVARWMGLGWVVTVEIRIPVFCLPALLSGGGWRCAGGVRPGNRTFGLCNCESGSGASLGALPGEGWSTLPFSEAASLTGTCVLREEGVAASGSSVSVQRREMCVLSKGALCGGVICT